METLYWPRGHFLPSCSLQALWTWQGKTSGEASADPLPPGAEHALRR